MSHLTICHNFFGSYQSFSEKCRGILKFAIRCRAALTSTVPQCVYNLWREQFKCTINPLMVTSCCILWGFSGSAVGIHFLMSQQRSQQALALPRAPSPQPYPSFNLLFFFHENFVQLPVLECQSLDTSIMFLLASEGERVRGRTGSYMHLQSQYHTWKIVGDWYLGRTEQNYFKSSQIKALYSLTVLFQFL